MSVQEFRRQADEQIIIADGTEYLWLPKELDTSDLEAKRIGEDSECVLFEIKL